VYLTYFYRLGYLCAKNYHIWWRFDEVLTKNKLGHFLAHPVLILFSPTLSHVLVNVVFRSMYKPIGLLHTRPTVELNDRMLTDERRTWCSV